MNKFYIGIDPCSDEGDKTCYVVLKYCSNGAISVVECDYIKHSEMLTEKHKTIQAEIDNLIKKYKADCMRPSQFRVETKEQRIETRLFGNRKLISL